MTTAKVAAGKRQRRLGSSPKAREHEVCAGEKVGVRYAARGSTTVTSKPSAHACWTRGTAS